jgi:hypothetical protein
MVRKKDYCHGPPFIMSKVLASFFFFNSPLTSRDMNEGCEETEVLRVEKKGRMDCGPQRQSRTRVHNQ